MTKTRELAGRRIPAADTHVPLARYDAACRALVEAKSVDEVMAIRDRAEAIRAYARQAKNKQLEIDAAEIRIRAEHRLGEKIAEQKATVGLNTGRAGRAPIAVPGGGGPRSAAPACRCWRHKEPLQRGTEARRPA
jgi:hypothetical protein